MKTRYSSLISGIIPFAVFIAVRYATSSAASLILVALGVGEVNAVMLASIAANAVCFLAAAAEMKLTGLRFCDISECRQPASIILCCVIFSAGAFFVLQYAGTEFLRLCGVTESDSFQKLLGSSIVLTAISSLTAPFGEELFFRGLMLKKFGEGFGKFFSAAAVTVLFALVHSDNMKFYAAIFSITLIALMYVFKDIRLCIIFHLTANLMSVVFYFIPLPFYATRTYLYALAGLFIAVAAFALMRGLAKKIKL